jgi:parallel beta-helix repeat protein
VANAPGNVVEHNTSFANPAPIACGVNVVGAGSVGNVVRHNETFANQFGVQVAGGAARNVVFHNWSHDNRRLGIRNIGGSNGSVIENNRVLANAFEGIAVLQSTGVTVARNKAFDNAPDLFWDGVGANTFENNHCRTSVPPGLCEHPEGASEK